MEPSNWSQYQGMESNMSAPQDLENATTTDRLSSFREQVGITEVLSLAPRPLKRSAPNIGIYRRVVSAEKNARLQYYASACLINSCLLLQIIFAAIITALGAANGSHAAITGVGAANTVIAGLLSFTKGQGLPNRLLQYQNTLRKVREYIEQRERDFAQLGCKWDLDHEIRTIVEMYENARQNDEANDPNAYNNPLDMSAKGKSTTPESTVQSTHKPESMQTALGKLAGHSEISHGATETNVHSSPEQKDV